MPTREVWAYQDRNGRAIGYIPRYGVLIKLDKIRPSLYVDDAVHQLFESAADAKGHGAQINITELHLVTTLTCPAKCTYCCVEHVKDSRYLQPEDAVAAIKHLKATPTSVSIFGGEPLLHPDKFDRLLEGIKPHLAPGASLSVSTGLLISNAAFQRSIEVLLKHDVMVCITIDNPDPGTAYTRGSNLLEDIERELMMTRWMHTNGVRLSVSSTLTRTSRKPCQMLRRVMHEISMDIPVGLTPLMVMHPDQTLLPDDLAVFERDLNEFLDYKAELGQPFGLWPGPLKHIERTKTAWRAGGLHCPSNVSAMAIMPDGGIGSCFTDPVLGAGLSVPTAESAAAWRVSTNTHCGPCELKYGCHLQCPKATPRGNADACRDVSRAFYRPMIRALIQYGQPTLLDEIIAAQPLQIET